MGFFKDFKDDFSQAVGELFPGDDFPDEDMIQVNTLDNELDVERELSKLDGLLEQVEKKTAVARKPEVPEPEKTSKQEIKPQPEFKAKPEIRTEEPVFKQEELKFQPEEPGLAPKTPKLQTEEPKQKPEEPEPHSGDLKAKEEAETKITLEEMKAREETLPETEEAPIPDKLPELEFEPLEEPEKKEEFLRAKPAPTPAAAKPPTPAAVKPAPAAVKPTSAAAKPVPPVTVQKPAPKAQRPTPVPAATAQKPTPAAAVRRPAASSVTTAYNIQPAPGIAAPQPKAVGVSASGSANYTKINRSANIKEEKSMDTTVTAAVETPEEAVAAPGVASEPMETSLEVTDEISLITAGTNIKGNMETTGSFEIEGRIEGDIKCNGKLTVIGSVVGNSASSEFFADAAHIEGEVVSSGTVKIGLGSVIIGNISATSAVIAGAVKGDIDVQGPVVVDTSAVIMGNIKSRSVQINNGAVIEGFCSQCYSDVDVQSLFEQK